MDRKLPGAKKTARKAIIRAVASSTAIETGKSVHKLETSLRDRDREKLSLRLRSLKLAD